MKMGFDYIIFDCDSTLSAIEGIDQLAEWAGCGDDIARLTDQAMRGEVSLEEVYAKRLDRIRPNQAQLEKLSDSYCKHELPGARELIGILFSLRKKIAVISGGLLIPVRSFAHTLDIPEKDVFAVSLTFDEQGQYTGVCDSPLTTAAGKECVAREWLSQFPTGRSVMIGDGSSDLAARPAVDAVIGYGGVCEREIMKQGADAFYQHVNLLGLLPALLYLNEYAMLKMEDKVSIDRLFNQFFQIIE